jgi:hypothetical protein
VRLSVDSATVRGLDHLVLVLEHQHCVALAGEFVERF